MPSPASRSPDALQAPPASAERSARARPVDSSRAERSPMAGLQSTAGNAAVGRMIEGKDGPRSVEEIALSGFIGSPEPIPNQQEVERVVGHKLPLVEVYSDQPAMRAARSLRADAFAVGNRIAIGAPQAQPQLLMHELAHVLQVENAKRGIAPTNDNAAIEADAEAASSRWLSGTKTLPRLSVDDASPFLSSSDSAASATKTQQAEPSPISNEQIVDGDAQNGSVEGGELGQDEDMATFLQSIPSFTFGDGELIPQQEIGIELFGTGDVAAATGDGNKTDGVRIGKIDLSNENYGGKYSLLEKEGIEGLPVLSMEVPLPVEPFAVARLALGGDVALIAKPGVAASLIVGSGWAEIQLSGFFGLDIEAYAELKIGAGIGLPGLNNTYSLWGRATGKAGVTPAISGVARIEQDEEGRWSEWHGGLSVDIDFEASLSGALGISSEINVARRSLELWRLQLGSDYDFAKIKWSMPDMGIDFATGEAWPNFSPTYEVTWLNKPYPTEKRPADESDSASNDGADRFDYESDHESICPV